MSIVLSSLSFSLRTGRWSLQAQRLVQPRAARPLGATIGRVHAAPADRRRRAAHVRVMAVTGEVGYLPQDLALDVDTTVASLLGIASVRDTVRAIEAGSVDPAAFDAVGDDKKWISSPRRMFPLPHSPMGLR